MSLSQNPSAFKLNPAEILQEAEGLLTGRWITDLANISALIMQHFENINWAGFYLVDANDSQTLWLGPFQGLPACTMIPLSKGVCGFAASTRQSILVDDVHQFPNHIACDSRSNSEVVIPMVKNNTLLGVLDVDSPLFARFKKEELQFLEALVELLLKKSNP